MPPNQALNPTARPPPLRSVAAPRASARALGERGLCRRPARTSYRRWSSRCAPSRPPCPLARSAPAAPSRSRASRVCAHLRRRGLRGRHREPGGEPEARAGARRAPGSSARLEEGGSSSSSRARRIGSSRFCNVNGRRPLGPPDLSPQQLPSLRSASQGRVPEAPPPASMGLGFAGIAKGEERLPVSTEAASPGLPRPRTSGAVASAALRARAREFAVQRPAPSC